MLYTLPLSLKILLNFCLLSQVTQVQCTNAEKYPDKLGKLFTLQNIANLQGIGFNLDFVFKICRDLTKSASFQFGFTRCICLKTTKRTQ